MDIPEGRYVVRAGDGGDEAAFEYRDGIVATSWLLDERFATLGAVAEELAWQHEATLELADRLASLLERWERGRCAQNAMRRHLTDCEFTSPAGYVPSGLDNDASPLPAETLEALGCVDVRQAPEGSPLECDLALAGRGESATMHASARSYNQVSRAATTVVWLTRAS